MIKATAALRLHEVEAGYGEVPVLKGISLEISAGEVVCLLGPNSVGKTTAMRVVTGLLPLAAGRVTFGGTDLAHVAAHDRVEHGIALVPEGRQVFPDLTVEDNLLLGGYTRRARPGRRARLEQIYRQLPRLGERKRQRAGLMSGGEQQMLAIGRALMSEPSLLLLDEPSLGLSPKMTQAVFDIIGEISRAGLGILLVEQNTVAALGIASRGYVLSDGRIVASGPSSDLRGSAIVREAFVGLAEAIPS